MALESFKGVLSTDKKYWFLEDQESETDGYQDLIEVLESYEDVLLPFSLGYDTDTRYWLLPYQLLAFNTETETENEE